MAHGTKHPSGHREGTVEVNGTGLRVEEAGHGEPAVVFSPALLPTVSCSTPRSRR